MHKILHSMIYSKPSNQIHSTQQKTNFPTCVTPQYSQGNDIQPEIKNHPVFFYIFQTFVVML